MRYISRLFLQWETALTTIFIWHINRKSQVLLPVPSNIKRLPVTFPALWCDIIFSKLHVPINCTWLYKLFEKLFHDQIIACYIHWCDRYTQLPGYYIQHPGHHNNARVSNRIDRYRCHTCFHTDIILYVLANPTKNWVIPKTIAIWSETLCRWRLYKSWVESESLIVIRHTHKGGHHSGKLHSCCSDVLTAQQMALVLLFPSQKSFVLFHCQRTRQP